MKFVLLTLFAAVYYGAWWLMKHNQEAWAFAVFVLCTFVLFPMLWALFSNGLAAEPAVAQMPVRSPEEMAYDNVLAPAADHEPNASSLEEPQSCPALPDDDEPSADAPRSQPPLEDTTATEPHKGQKELF
jgi:hypothetical protein